MISNAPKIGSTLMASRQIIKKLLNEFVLLTKNKDKQSL